MRSLATYVAALTIGLTLAATPAVADPPDGPITPPTATSAPAETPPPTETSTATGAPSPSEQPPAAQPPAAEQPKTAAVAERPKLEVTGEFDKPSYTTGELISIKIRIKNAGTEQAAGLFLSTQLLIPTDLRFDPRQLGELGGRPGATIEPGATLEKTVSGHPGQADTDVATLTGNIFGADGFGVAEFKFSAPVKKTVSHVAGTVFGDKNGNGKFDSDEELEGAKLTWSYADGGQFQFVKEATSGKDGKFDFGEIPTVRYFTTGQASGWAFPFDVVKIDASKDNTHFLIRAQRPVKDRLQAKMEFTKDSYQLGELAHVKVTLTNSGSIPIVDIRTGCNRSGEGPQLTGTGPGWAALDDGVTLAAGETKVLEVTEKVPESARIFGFVFVSCDFGFGDGDIEDHAFAGDDAIVQTDLRATFSGQVKSFPDGPGKPGVGLAGVRVVLAAPGACPIVGDTTTDADGKFEFTSLLPGPDRKVYLVPPRGWRIQGDNPETVLIVATRDGQLVFTAEPGAGTAPEIPTQSASCNTPPPATEQPATPEPQGRSGGGLASTGASVVGLSALGALALLVGAGAVVTTRRRRTAGQ